MRRTLVLLNNIELAFLIYIADKFYNLKITVAFLLILISINTALGQQTNNNKSGHYFKQAPGEYFDRVIKPWNYQFTVNTTDSTNDNTKKIGSIVFWRTIAIPDQKINNWKPNINFDIYTIEDIDTIANLSQKIKEASTCDSLSKGGSIILVGHFVLICPTLCTNCISSNNIDYCSNIIKKIFGYVEDKQTTNWTNILKQLPIGKGKYNLK